MRVRGRTHSNVGTRAIAKDMSKLSQSTRNTFIGSTKYEMNAIHSTDLNLMAINKMAVQRYIISYTCFGLIVLACVIHLKRLFVIYSNILHTINTLEQYNKTKTTTKTSKLSIYQICMRAVTTCRLPGTSVALTVKN